MTILLGDADLRPGARERPLWTIEFDDVMGLPARTYEQADMVAVMRASGSVKILKNRFGLSGHMGTRLATEQTNAAIRHLAHGPGPAGRPLVEVLATDAGRLEPLGQEEPLNLPQEVRDEEEI